MPTRCQSWSWPLTPWPKINRVPPLVFHNLHVKSESDWAKTIVCIVSTMYYTQCQSWPWPMTQWPKINRVSSSHHPQLTGEVWKWLGYICSLYHVHKVLYKECQCWHWPLTPWPKINMVPPLIIHNLHVKSESDWAKSVVGIVSTRSYTQSAKIDFDLWSRDRKSKGPSSHHPQLTCEVWKWLIKNCSRYRVHKVKRDGPTNSPTHPLTHSPIHPRTAALLYLLQRCCERKTNPLWVEHNLCQ